MPQILVIEDDPILRGEVVEWLTFEGYAVLSAADGRAGLDLACAHQPDLIVCDIMMPQLDGYQVLIALRTQPDTANIPLIFVTARVTHADLRQGMQLGADDYLTKPFTHSELLQAIRVRLAKKAAQDQAYQRTLAQVQQALTQEQEGRLLRTKLMALFAHDFRNPITAILLANDVLYTQSERLDPNQRVAHSKRIKGAALQLTRMLDEVLLVAQLETAQWELQLEPLALGQWLQQLVEDFRIMSGENHPILLESQLMAPLLMDARLFRHIVANLLSNALKYSPVGSPVRVLVDSAADQCRLQVQDQGIGIPAVDQPRLFEAFQRASNVGKAPGTGLGLALVKQAVTFLGGSIQVESQVGQGTTVTVLLPLQSAVPT